MEKLDDKTLDFLEQQIPDLAAAAVTIAYNQALSAGLSVLQIEGNQLIEQFPNGTKRVLKKWDRERQNGD